MRSLQTIEDVRLDDRKFGIFRRSARHRHSRTPVHKARWRFGLVRNAQPAHYEAETGRYQGNAG
jgi:hypothetical protein